LKRTISTRVGIFILALLVISLFILPACSNSATTSAPAAPAAPAASAAPAAPAAPAASSASAAPAAPAAPAASAGPNKVLKVGYIGDMSWPATLDAMKMFEVYKILYDKAGGLDIGGQKYDIQFVLYDSKGQQAVGTAAANRLVYEDKVKYVLSDFTPLSDAYLPIFEANKVIFSATTVTPPIFDPKNHYCFETGALPGSATCAPFWLAKNFPQFKTAVSASPDTQMGHMGGADCAAILRAAGLKVTEIYYPVTSQDLSSLGSAVKQANPDICVCQGGGPIQDSLAQKAVYQAGYRGQFFTAPPSTNLVMQQVTPPEVLEGQILSGIPCEFDPPLTQAAADFKTAFLAKYGKYQGETLGMAVWEAARTAMQSAGTTDTDKVADVLANGLKYSGAPGDYQMVARMDHGNARTVDSAMKIYMKRVVKGQPVLIGTMSVEEAVQVQNNYYVAKK
jgi:branched-chain amino acid transport system substrate-binding protein